MNFVSDYLFKGKFMNAWDFESYPPFQKNTIEEYKIFESANPDVNQPGVWCIDRNRICDVKKSTFNRIFDILDENGNTIDNKEYIYRIDMYGGIGNAFPAKEKSGEGDGMGHVINKNNVLDLIPTKTLNAIKKNSNISIMLNYFQEGIVEYFHLRDMHESLHKLEIPAEKCILSFGGHNIDDWYAQFCRNYGITQKIKVVYHSWVWQTKSSEFDNYKKDYNWKSNKDYPTKELIKHINTDYNVEIKKYNFNCLNRRLRTHRLYTLAVLEKEGLLDENIVTYDFTISENIPHIVELTEFDIAHNHIYNFKPLKDYLLHLYENKPKKTYDYDDLQTLFGINHERASVYEDSMFSLVTETTVLPNEYYISEKVVKPLGHNHPFIVFGSVGTLEHLKKMGFKTFEPYIDESYDKEPSPEKRFNLILEQVKLLCNKSDEEKLEWMHNVNPILKHNSKHLASFVDIKSYYAKYHSEVNKLIKHDYSTLL
jgi:hypothetical protein